MRKVSGIYKIVNKATGKCYIGGSKDITKRWRAHKTNLKRKEHHNYRLTNDWHKYGKDGFEFSVIEEVAEDRLFEVEQRYLDLCAENPDGYYNMNYSPDGGRPSDESIEKIKKKLRGRVLSEEHRRNISKGITGRYYSSATREKIGNFSSKRVHTEETRAKISKALTGKKRSEETKRKIRESHFSKSAEFHAGNKSKRDVTIRTFRNTSGEVFVGTRIEFIKRFDLVPSSVCDVIHGKQKAVRGWSIDHEKNDGITT